MTEQQRAELMERIEHDINLMMSRAGQILMEHVEGLSEERLIDFSKNFNENHRTQLLDELTTKVNTNP